MGLVISTGDIIKIMSHLVNLINENFGHGKQRSRKKNTQSFCNLGTLQLERLISLGDRFQMKGLPKFRHLCYETSLELGNDTNVLEELPVKVSLHDNIINDKKRLRLIIKGSKNKTSISENSQADTEAHTEYLLLKITECMDLEFDENEDIIKFKVLVDGEKKEFRFKNVIDNNNTNYLYCLLFFLNELEKNIKELETFEEKKLYKLAIKNGLWPESSLEFVIQFFHRLEEIPAYNIPYLNNIQGKIETYFCKKGESDNETFGFPYVGPPPEFARD